MKIAAILSLLSLTGPTGEVPWPQTQPSLVRLDRMDLADVVYYEPHLAVGMRWADAMRQRSEAVVWSPYYGTKRLSDHIRGRGTWSPDFASVAFACRVDDSLQCVAFDTGGSRWFVAFSDPEMFPCRRGDFDCDGDIDQTDFGMLQVRLGEMRDDQFDLDRDGSVTVADVEVFRTLMQGAR